MTEPGACISCPQSAICNGGSDIGPSPGYWRRSNETDNFLKCESEDACLGMVAPDNNPRGSCSTGYQGILCSDCAAGFSRVNKYDCAQCPDKVNNLLRMIGILIGVIFLLVLMVKSTLDGAV